MNGSRPSRRRCLAVIGGGALACVSPVSAAMNWAVPLRYLIGKDDPGAGKDGEIIEVSYDVGVPPQHGLAIKYGNLFDEKNSGKYGPYLKRGDTASQYNEGQIDPRGAGWIKNLQDQIDRARAGGFTCIEWDNADAYSVPQVTMAVEMASEHSLLVAAKNPLIMRSDPLYYVAHPAVVGVVVERGAGDPYRMDALRLQAGKPDLPVWFVFFGGGKISAHATAIDARNYKNMWVTYSRKGEYQSSEDVT